MKIQQIDGVDTEPAQAGIDGSRHIVRSAVDSEGKAPIGREFRSFFILIEHDTELGGDERLADVVRKCLADKFFVVSIAIAVGGVDHHAQVHRPGDRRNASRIIRLAIIPFKDHGAITDCGD